MSRVRWTAQGVGTYGDAGWHLEREPANVLRAGHDVLLGGNGARARRDGPGGRQLARALVGVGPHVRLVPAGLERSDRVFEGLALAEAEFLAIVELPHESH